MRGDQQLSSEELTIRTFDGRPRLWAVFFALEKNAQRGPVLDRSGSGHIHACRRRRIEADRQMQGDLSSRSHSISRHIVRRRRCA